MAYKALAFPTTSPITPLFDVLVAGGLVDAFGMQLCGSRAVRQGAAIALRATPSFLELGASAASMADLAVGSFAFAPVTEELYYGVRVLGMAVAGTPLDVPCAVYNSPRAIVDRFVVFPAWSVVFLMR